jgi:hypothetical protein
LTAQTVVVPGYGTTEAWTQRYELIHSLFADVEPAHHDHRCPRHRDAELSV